jgi:hypothetical protein
MSAQSAIGTPESSTVTVSGNSASSVARRRMRRATLGMIVGLVIQFVAGMLLNLFTKMPDSHPGSNPSDYFSGSLQSMIWAIMRIPVDFATRFRREFATRFRRVLAHL